MKNATIAGVVLILAAGVLAADGLKGFQKTFVQAQKAAQASGKPIYLHFTTTWCGWCRKIESEVYASEQGQKALQDFVPASVDCTVAGTTPSVAAKFNLDLMKRFAVSGYPSLVIVTADGAVLHSWSGYLPTDRFIQELDKASKAFEEYKALQAEANKLDRTSYEGDLKMMNAYVKFQKWDSAADLAGQVRKLDPNGVKGDGARAAYVQFKAAVALGQPPDKVKAALESVKKADPKNDKGQMERAMLDQAGDDLAAGKFREGIAGVSELISKAAQLKQEQRVYYILGLCQEQAKDIKTALATLEKALALDPTSRMAGFITAKIQQLKGNPGTSAH